MTRMPAPLAKSIVCVLLFLHVIGVWLFPYFVTQDGPSHLENAYILKQFATAPLFRDYLKVNPTPAPNWFGHLLEAGLLIVTSSAIAEKILISLYLLLMFSSALYTVRSVAPESQWHSVLVLPLVLNCLLQYGFFNFCWSAALFLLFSGYWMRRRSIEIRSSLIAALLLVLIYFSHVVSWFVCLLFACLVAGARLRSGEWKLREASLAIAAFVPSALLTGWFLTTLPPNSATAVAVPFAPRWSALWHASTVVFSYSKLDAAVSTAFGVSLLLAAAVLLLQRRWNAWTLLAGLLTILYFVSPSQAGIGQYVLERWNFYVLLAMAVWIASCARGWAASLAIVAGSAAISCALLALVVVREREINRELAEYLSVAADVQPGATLLPVQFDSRGPGDLQHLYGFPMRHAAGYVAAARGALNLDNYEAQTAVFPLIFRERFHPGVYIGHMEDEPPAPDFAGYEAKTGRRVDYVLVWDPLLTSRRTSRWAAIETQLLRYRLVKTSPSGWASLYRHQ